MPPLHGQDVGHEMLPLAEQHSRRDAKSPSRPRTYKVAASMVCSIIVGLLFGLIHHFFYAYWNGKVVSSDSQQRWIIRGGTAFAFGLKTALALGTSIAYVQYFWLTLSSRDLQVNKINTMFQVLGNAFDLADLKLWFKLPILFVLATITWTLPLAAIVSPGTLIVTASTRNRTQQIGVPQFDYRDYTKFASPLPADENSFSSAGQGLRRLAIGSAATQSILSISPPVANSTYSINMYAPALICQEARDNDTMAINEAYRNYSNSAGGAGITYFSWVPSNDDGGICSNGSMTIPSDWASATLPDTTDFCYSTGQFSKKLNIYMPHTFSYHEGDYTWWDSVLLNCSLHNASYKVDFDFRDRAQIVNVRQRELINGVVGESYYPYLFNTSSEWKDQVTMANRQLSYLSVLDAFGRLMVGAITTYHYGTISSAYTLVLSTGLRSLISDDIYSNYTTSNATFASAVENLFENVTISLLSANDFIVDFSNATEAAGLSLTPVTVYYPQNIYTYKPEQLWLAYGIAMLANVLCLLAGVFAMRRNGLSYTNDFTTIMRTTRNPNLDLLVPESESNGAEPVLDWTKKGTLTYRRSNDYGWSGFSIKGMQ